MNLLQTGTGNANFVRMNSGRIWLGYVVVMLTYGSGALATTTYFVATTGSDLGSGTQASPWQTIQKATASVAPGDTVEVMPGIYPERVKVTTAGTAGQPITFKASGAVTNFGFYINRSFITIDGFNIIGNTNTPNWEGSIEVYRGLTSINILNNYIHDFDPINTSIFGIHFYYSVDASTATANCMVSNNILRNTSYVMLSINCSNSIFCDNVLDFANSHDAIQCWGAFVTIRGNLFTNISSNPQVPDHTDIIQTFGDEPSEAYNIVFEQNMIVNCQAQLCQLEQKGRNIQNWTFRNNVWANLANGGNCDLVDCKWYNNTFYHCTTNTSGPILLNCNVKGCASNAEVFNNIFFECGAIPTSPEMGWYAPENTNFTFAADYNFVCGTGGAAKGTSYFTEPHGINGGDPLFVDPAHFNLRLKTGSPLINKGRSILSVSNDFANIVRPQGASWDIGAYEFQSVVLKKPAPPSQLRVQ
jgi:hypothetical protein